MISTVLFLALNSEGVAARYVPAAVNPPKPMRELRGAWIATVSNIDWPSTNGLSTAQQKAELLAILDRAKSLKLNTLIFQVRPGCDALYASRLEPWSEYLTGTMGKAPQPFYDPLEFAVREAHKRGLELHAWFNPYRARHANARSPVASNHISRTRPQLVKLYGRSLWLDPGEKEVQDYSVSVVLDVVARYDIDGVHIDDYFYPYKEKDNAGRELDFPDEASWARYGAGHGLDRADWRRENVNVFVRRLYESIRNRKPWVKFGVSPFGIWRPGNPAQIQGFDAYAELYADSRKWLNAGWADYFAPQLYWAIEPPQQSFPVLLNWWGSQNSAARLLAPGLDSTKIGRRWPAEEIINQIRLTRKTGNAAGHIHWNMRALMRSESLGAALQQQVYREPALAPTPSRLAKESTPAKPQLTARVTGSAASFNWKPAAGQPRPWLWVVQKKQADEWSTVIFPGAKTSCTFSTPIPKAVAVSPVGRAGNIGLCSGLRQGD